MPHDGIKIVAYNILDGGLGRLDPIYETLLYLDADIIGLCEADDPKGVAYLARKLNMDHVLAEGSSGHHVALLSRRPIVQMINLAAVHENLDRGAMEVVVEWEARGQKPEAADRRPEARSQRSEITGHRSEELRILVVHLAPGQSRDDELKRLAQLDAVLDWYTLRPGPKVLMGDFNAAASYHPFDFDRASPKVKKRLTDRPQGPRPDYDVTDRIAARGWVDAYHHVHPHGAKQTYTTGFPCSRFDYIWLSPDLAGRVKECDAEQGGFAPYCSDHYPIWVRID